MEKPKLINTDNYLRKIEVQKTEITDGTLQALLERISIPTEGAVYENEGEVHFMLDGIRVTFTYNQLDDDTRKELLVDLSSRASLTLDSTDLLNLSQWRTVKDLYFSTESGKKLLTEIMPSKHKVLFNPTATVEDHTGMVCMGTKNIYILGDMATPRAIATLLHEIGHTWDQKNLDDHGVSNFMDGHDSAYRAEKIRSERSATAFAFKLMRILPKGELKDDLIIFLKVYALESYYEEARRLASNDREMTKFWGPDPFPEMNEEWLRMEEMMDIFDEWKKTEAYQRWKKGDEFNHLDEYEEYGVWSEWVEKTKYDYLRDLPYKPDDGNS